MSWWLVLCMLTFWVISASAVEERKVHRLIGGHLKIFQGEDVELLEALSSGSKNKKAAKGDDDEKKTLSQQVADGKYGLIQKELFSKLSKRPGVLSYENNPEVPKDNLNNLGGLTKNDIWLAENHLLVLKGGTYPPHDNKNENSATPWPAIDDYKAPLRQVKIPAHPKIPPPFPVQLTDDGPLQILGTNSSRTLNGTLEETSFAVLSPEGYQPSNKYLPPSAYPYPPNSTAGQAPYPIPPYPPGEYHPGSPFPPYNLNGTLPPFFASLPPGTVILPPPPNQTDFDEDDPSIYYPPPYSFYYPKDNSSLVPPGPLVPGIVLPPPPNFFGSLEPKSTTTTTTRKPNRFKFKTTTTTPSPQIRATTTAVPPTSVLGEQRQPIRILPVQTPSEINNELKPIVTTKRPKVVTVLSVKPQVTKNRTLRPTVTVLKSVSEPPKLYYYDRPSQRVNTVVSSTQVPLKVYYSTSNEIESNSITHPPEKYHVGVVSNSRRVKTTTKSPAQYYYYEEQQPKELNTRRPFYDVTKEYYLQTKTEPTQQQKYIYVPTQRPRYRFVQTPKTDTFSIHIARLQKQIHQYLTTTHRPKPVYQFSFEATNYRQKDSQDKFRPLPKYSVQIQPAIEIVPTEGPLPNYYQATTERSAPSEHHNRKPQEYGDYGHNKPTSRPISQYAFEATPNPVGQGFYTKPDEGYFDENTKQYFSTFGRKIPTTPIPESRRQTRPVKQKPVNLESDIAVNYLPSRPNVNPDAEFVPIDPAYPQILKYRSRPAQYAQESRQLQRPDTRNPQGSYISYQLPGDEGAHFYFLTPQLAQSRSQGAGYYYNAPRIRRNKER